MEGENEEGFVPFHFDEKDMFKLGQEMGNCMRRLGTHKHRLDIFFNINNGYRDDMIAADLGIDMDDVKSLLVDYARLELGEKIRDCIARTGHCDFEAEL